MALPLWDCHRRAITLPPLTLIVTPALTLIQGGSVSSWRRRVIAMACAAAHVMTVSWHWQCYDTALGLHGSAMTLP